MSQPRDESWTPSGSGKAPYPFQPSYNAADDPPAPPRTLGERLRVARYSANLTQEELAGGNFSKSYISAVERGKMTPSISALRFLAARLDVSLAYLLGEDFPNQEAPLAGLGSLTASQEPSLEDQLARRFEDTEQLLTRGDPDAALKRLGDQPTAADLGQTHQIRWTWLYAWALAQQHREQEANVMLEQGLKAAHASQDLHSQGHLYFTFATANVNRSEDAAVEQAYQEAIRCFEQTGSSNHLVCVHEQYSAFLAAHGRYQEAYEQISRAQAASARSDSER